MSLFLQATPDATLEEVLATIPGIVEAFSSGGVWAGLIAVFATVMVALNFGPLKTWLAASPLDWLRPALMLVSVGATAGITAALTTGASVLSAVIAGALAGLGSGYLQKLIQEATD